MLHQHAQPIGTAHTRFRREPHEGCFAAVHHVVGQGARREDADVDGQFGIAESSGRGVDDDIELASGEIFVAATQQRQLGRPAAFFLQGRIGDDEGGDG